MSAEQEVLRIGKKLEKIISKKEGPSQALDMLRSLQSISINLDVLQKTRIGMTVNKLRKSITDEEVISLAKTLIKSWKKLLSEKETKPDVNSQKEPQKNPNNGNNEAAKRMGEDNKSKLQLNKPTPASSSPIIKQTSFPPTDTTNSVRLKCREMLANALKPDDNIDEALLDHEDLAVKIEDSVFKEFKDTGMKYKNRIRSRVSNLKDSKNPDLKLNVLRGVIKAEKIAVMTADEMASKEMQALRQQYTKESINDHQMAVTGGTKTDLLKCPKCKKSNCTYNQVQTRSADEPMTTFCLCNECGRRWKFC